MGGSISLSEAPVLWGEFDHVPLSDSVCKSRPTKKDTSSFEHAGMP